MPGQISGNNSAGKENCHEKISQKLIKVCLGNRIIVQWDL
ncbi:hypothetical protein DOY81_009208 [Sarcophaga bullata]|nr:hypothetical protein DOY81_009208 [Sarcophaga bullata]